MPLITSNQVVELIDILSKRDVRLVHACQLKEFLSYLRLGGVPSRAALEKAKAAFTPFDTDSVDHANGVWERVFFNFSDFGHWFGCGKNSLPNPYGPIALVLNPQALQGAHDVSVTLRSAGAKNFDRVGEALLLEEIPKLFVERGVLKRHVKFTNQLQEAFPGRSVTTPELNCTLLTQTAPIGQLRFVLVDNYPGLIERVRDAMAQHGLKKKVVERFATEARKITYRVLWNKVASGCEDVSLLGLQSDIDEVTKSWCDAVASWDKDSFQFRRYARYLKSGTIEEMSSLGAGISTLSVATSL